MAELAKTPQAVCYDFFGLGGIFTDPNQKAFALRVQKEVPASIGPSPYQWNDYDKVAASIKALPANVPVILSGASFGANILPYVAQLVYPRPIRGIWGFQASSWGVRVPIPDNVMFAHLMTNPNAIMTLGMGSYVWEQAATNKKTNLHVTRNYDLHPGDWDKGMQDVFLAEMQRCVR